MFDLTHQRNGTNPAWKTAKRRPHPALAELDAYAIGACMDRQVALCDVGLTAGFGGALTNALYENDALPLFANKDDASVIEAFSRVNGYLRHHSQVPVLQTCMSEEMKREEPVIKKRAVKRRRVVRIRNGKRVH